MDHQGAGRPRSAADTRRQASWPWPQSDADPGKSAETAPQPVLRTPNGPSQTDDHRGTGAQRRVGSGSGANARPKRRLASRPALLAAAAVVAVAAAGFGGYKF